MMLAKIKKQKKNTKRCIIKRKLKFENYKTSLEANKLDNEIKYQEKNKININSLKENREEFIRNNKSILKMQ